MQDLIKALHDTYVPTDTNNDNMKSSIRQVVLWNFISFYDKEVPFEENMHKETLHVTIMWIDKIIIFLIDDGSDINIFPLLTLTLLNLNLEKVNQNQVIIWDFDVY